MSYIIWIWLAFPRECGGLKQAERTHHVCVGEGERVLDGTVYMTLCSQMDDAVHMVLLHQCLDGIAVADVSLYKRVVGLIFYIFEVGQVAGISQFVEIDDMVVGVFVDKESDYMTADEAGSAGNDDIAFEIHCFPFLMCLLSVDYFSIAPMLAMQIFSESVQ